MMKKCSKCGEEKPATIEFFYNRKAVLRWRGGLSAACIECELRVQRRVSTESRRDKKQRLVDRFGKKCASCGYSKCLAALEFHHRDPNQKEFRLSGNSLLRRKFETLVKEAEKCMLLCANCHRELHYNESQEH